MPCLDTPRRDPYKPRALGVALLLAVVPWVAQAEMVSGAQLPDSAQKVAEHRYRASQSYEETLKYYKTVYPPAAFPRKAIINQPGIKAVHITNPSGKGFEGLNIYEANEEVRVYVLAPLEAKPKKKEGKKR